jgi:hypothetical protein
MYSKTISPDSETKIQIIYRMSLSNLTSNRPPGNVLSNFYSKRQQELLNKEAENAQNYVFLKNTIIIPKKEFSKLKSDFGFFATFIQNDFTNSDEYFDKNGNYILKKDLLPEEMPFYDKNTQEAYIIERDEVWNGLQKALSDYHVPDKILADYIADFFIYKEPGNSLFNPTIPELNTVSKPNGVYFAEPSRAQLKKTRRKARELQELRNELNEGLNNNDYLYRLYLAPITENELLEFSEKEKRQNVIEEIKAELKRNKKANVENLVEILQNTFRRTQIAQALNQTTKAMANRTKYVKESERRRKPLSEKYKEKRKTQRRKKQRARKTAKHSRANNNENGNGNYGNNNNNRNNEEY